MAYWGLMTSPSWRSFRQSRPRHSSIWSHQAFRALRSGRALWLLGLPALQMSLQHRAGVADDRQVDHDVLVDRQEGSISMWIFLEPGENSSSGR